MRRIVPRDLFNDANLLKCIGKLVLEIHDDTCDWLGFEYDMEPFNIQQDPSSGATYVANIRFFPLKDPSKTIHIQRNLNTREAWELWAEFDHDSYPIFDDEGNIIFTEEVLKEALAA